MIVEIALKYAELGLAVVPCHHVNTDGSCSCGKSECKSQGKHPRVGWKENQERFLNPEWIKNNFKENDNLAILTGKISGVSVVDMDTHDRTIQESGANLTNILGEIKCNLASKTPSGGRHFYYKFGLDGDGEIPGVGQIKSAGICVEYPSKTGVGNYEWMNEINPTNTVCLGLFDFPKQLIRVGKEPIKLNEIKTPAERHNALLHYGVTMKMNVGFVYEELLSALRWYNETHCSPPKSDREIVSLAQWIEKTVSSPYNSNGEEGKFEPYSDALMGEEFAMQYSNVARYCSTEKRWYTWNNYIWIPDDSKQRDDLVNEFFKKHVNVLDKQIKDLEEKTDNESLAIKKALEKIRKNLCSRRKHEDVLAKARGLMDINPREFNTKNDMFNVKNGTMDLNDAKGYEPLSDDLMTQCGNVVFDTKAQCPEWEKFIACVIPEEDRREFLRRWCAYSLWGHAREQKILICVGGGANGKSTFFNVIGYIMGDYFNRLDPNIFLEDSRDNQLYHIARMNHKRLVVASETKAGVNIFSDSFLKKIAGEEELPARHPYGRPFDMKMQATPVLLTNSLPALLQIDDAIKRRLLIMTWNIMIVGEEVDENLGEKLKTEASGILNWILRGVEDYNKYGLAIPDSVMKETDDNLSRMNLLQNFAEDCLRKTGNQEDISLRSEIVLAYGKWCSENSVKPLGRNIFLKNLEKNGIFFTKDYRFGYIARGVRIIAESDQRVAMELYRQNNKQSQIAVV